MCGECEKDPGPATVADELWLESLPAEDKAKIARLFFHEGLSRQMANKILRESHG